MNQEGLIYREIMEYYAVIICMMKSSLTSLCIVTNYLGLMWAAIIDFHNSFTILNVLLNLSSFKDFNL